MTPLPENEVEKEVQEKGLLDIDDILIKEPEDEEQKKERQTKKPKINAYCRSPLPR